MDARLVRQPQAASMLREPGCTKYFRADRGVNKTACRVQKGNNLGSGRKGLPERGWYFHNGLATL